MQLVWVLRHGTCLANRWEDDGGVNLYHCAGDGRGFFVEVGITGGRGGVVLDGLEPPATPAAMAICVVYTSCSNTS